MMKDNENLENLENQEEGMENENANSNDNVDIEENIEDLKEEAQVSEEKKKEEDELKMFKKYKDENKKLTNELETLKDRLLRVSAEYENYRKRTTKEKEGIYTDACIDVLKEIVPNLDNLERALEANGNIEDMKKGVEMTLKGFRTALEKLGVEEIETKDGFDPNFHQAVMHVQDENLDENSVAEVFMKGYKRGDKVIRHSVVKVAN
ncbi:MAG: nucleotide exchange factor GrpE [Clostridium baratii]|uniref:Protein GrpE n=2 Tax=Clostridium baratii TaxID=1561 RepID=A0A0A7FVH6_9CLOT|nr:nucleotide exchange factor GrpE [Clostridium baratii]AIY83593.1 grpE family protein [Clostridium baratii str. Sullivan]MBS6006440.1 nucleotide exchange factor GrpE [Clostridium baratii]MDU1053890.1 nucleotide exchange factor GrpE [Clostridium baratii]MDU4910793.1 nucleotide exchange factor GrpE [Clostridium baratii]CUO90109.1 heat shock protein GrpE [Clostridium baratii]